MKWRTESKRRLAFGEQCAVTSQMGLGVRGKKRIRALNPPGALLDAFHFRPDRAATPMSPDTLPPDPEA